MATGLLPDNGLGTMRLDGQNRLLVSPLGTGELTVDAWGSQKVSLPHSLFHSLFTFDVPASQWLFYHGATEVSSSANVTSVGSAGRVAANATQATVSLVSRASPRYQPNRGHLFSTACWLPNKTNDGIREFGLSTAENGIYFRLKADGLLYAVRRTLGVEVQEEVIDTSSVPNFDVQKGNVYDIQYQWRGVGNYTFFINLVAVHTFSLLGTLTALSMADPALPAYYKSVRTTQDVSIYIGCVDITSENGSDDRLQYGSVYAAVTANGTNVPVVTIHNPLIANSVTNTRMLELARISLTSDKKALFKVWVTRDSTAFTGMALASTGAGSNVTSDSDDASVGAVKATAVDVAKLRLVTSIPVQANVQAVVINPFQGRIDFPLVRGDYLVVTCTATTAAIDAVVEYGEAL